MLLKPFQYRLVPKVQAQAAQAYSRVCHDTYRGPPRGSVPTPGARCSVVYVYGTPSPIDHLPTILRYYTVCV